MAILRVWFLGFLAVAAWFLASDALPHPSASGTGAPLTEFSAARAQTILARLLADEKPHPAGSAANAAMHARVTAELARLGIVPQTLSGMSCFSRARGDGGAIGCATVSDLVAEAIPGSGKAILLMAHMDSVAAGPGAADDASGVATVLETVRALKAQGASDRPVIVLFTDGEELGLLGSQLFLSHREWTARVGAVINAEARGNQGISYLFQTGAGDGRLIDLYAADAPYPATSSLYGEIYRYLPNDTDFTPFLRAGFTGYNFAFIGDVGQYHTALDRRANMDPASLQAQGDNVLAAARGLEGAGMSALASDNAIYFDLGHWLLPRLPRVLALPLAAGAFLVIALAGWLNGRGRPKRRGRLTGWLMPPLLLLGAVTMGFALTEAATLLAGDPPFAHPAALRVALAAGVWALSLLAMRGAGATASWLWIAGFGVASAVLAPGLSPYFIFPALVAAVLLLLTVGYGRGAALFVAALAMLAVWIGFAAEGEAIMGIAAHPLFTIPAAMAMIALLPLAAGEALAGAGWSLSFGLSLLVALGATLVAGFEPPFSAAQPERLNLRYVEKDGSSWWLADPVAHLPASLRAAAAFSGEPEILAAWRGYVARAGIVQLPSPSATVARSGSQVTLDLHGSAEADGMLLVVPQGVRSAQVGDVTMPAPKGKLTIACGSRDCGAAHVVLDFAGPVPKSVLLVEERYGLPSDAAFLLKARPDWAEPSVQGDMSYAAEDVMLPGS